jgi:hypothetical protein
MTKLTSALKNFGKKIPTLFSKTLEERLLERQELKWKGGVCVEIK